MIVYSSAELPSKIAFLTHFINLQKRKLLLNSVKAKNNNKDLNNMASSEDTGLKINGQNQQTK